MADGIRWMRLMSVAGIPATTIPNNFSSQDVEAGEEGADNAEEEEDKDPEALVEEAMELAKKLRKLVSTAVCADRRVPVDTAMKEEQPPDVSNVEDEEEKRLLLLKWRLEQKEKVLKVLEAEESDQPFEPASDSQKSSNSYFIQYIP
jgi:hypothetical protein